MGKVLINQSHCCLDSSPDNIALCVAEATGLVLFLMWCNGTSSLPVTPWSQLPKCHVCREWQSFCHQGKSKILARQSPCTVSHYWSGKGKADRPVLQTQALSKGTQRLAMLPSGSLSSSVLLPSPNWITLGRFLNICRLPHRVGINLGSVHNGAMVRTCKPLAQWPSQIQWWWVLSRSHWWQCVFSWHHNTGLKVLLLPPAKCLNSGHHSTSGAVCFYYVPGFTMSLHLNKPTVNENTLNTANLLSMLSLGCSAVMSRLTGSWDSLRESSRERERGNIIPHTACPRDEQHLKSKSSFG